MVRKKTTFNKEPSLQKQYEEIMEYFDFLHVQQMMHWEKALVTYDDDGNHQNYHQWMMWIGNELKIPSIEELRAIASKLLKSTIRFAELNPKSEFYMEGTGPFRAMYRYGALELLCDFKSWSND